MFKPKTGRCRICPPRNIQRCLPWSFLLLAAAAAPAFTWAKNPQPEKQPARLRTADFRLRLTKENIATLQAAQPASGVAPVASDGDEPEKITSGKALPLKLLDSSRGARLEKSQQPAETSSRKTVQEDAQANAAKPGALEKNAPAADEPRTLELEDSPTGDALSGSQSAAQAVEQDSGLDLVPSVAEPEPTNRKAATSHLSDGQLDEQEGKECPGAPDGKGAPTSDVQPDDVPLESDEHPYDAPPATSEDQPESSVVDDPGHQFTARELEIQSGINRCLAHFLENPETVVRRGPWALMHAVLPFGVETDVIAGNRRVNAIGWMCYNGVCARQRMFQPTRTGFRTNVGPGVQGHEGQFLAILAQSRVPSTYPIKIGSREYTVADLVRYEMATCREKSELTFKLIGLSYYLTPDQSWRDNRGTTWNLEKMVVEEMAQQINGAACGGSHRLMGLSYAIIERQRRGGQITGNWARAESYLNDYINYTMSLQNPDGSFSTNWFEGRGDQADVERKVQTTGHMLEWLIYTLPDEHLRSPRIQLSIEFLLNTIGSQPTRDWPIGPRGHALRAMALYNQRVFGAEVGKLREHLTAQQAAGMLR